MHLDQELIERVVDGERIPDPVSEHLAACAGCRSRVARAGDAARRVEGLLASLDDGLEMPALRLAARPVVSHPVMRRAAGIVLVAAAAGAAYAWPGSPLPSLLDHVTGAGPVPTAEPPVQAEPPRGGLAIDPGDSVAVRFLADFDGTILLRLVETGDLTVRASPAAVTFTAGVRDIRVRSRLPGETVFVEVPATAPLVVVSIGEEIVWRKAGDAVDTRATPTEDGYRFGPAVSP